MVSQETVDNLQRSFKVAEAELAQSRAAKVVAEQDVAVQDAEIRTGRDSRSQGGMGAEQDPDQITGSWPGGTVSDPTGNFS